MAPIGIRITSRRARCSTEGVFNSGLRRYDAGTAAHAWRPEWVCYYFINDAAPPSFVVDVSAHYEQKRRALRCHVSQFKVPVSDGVETRLTSPLFEQLVESRDAQFGALAGVAVRRRRGRARSDGAAEPVQEPYVSAERRTPNPNPNPEPRTLNPEPSMNIGIICYASVGGSGIVATELAKALADRGHQVHLVSTDPPFRLGDYQAGLVFHQVNTPSYPLFREPQYVLSLANKVVQVAREYPLQIIHAHYAIPHATAALLSKQVLESGGHPVPRVVTTLHGTDITLVGSDPSFSEIVAYSIETSDGVTAVSESLRAATRRELGVRRDIEVIPNCLDCEIYRRRSVPGLRQRFAPDEATKLVIHVSNFRPVKRIDAVMEVFARISRAVPARLLLVGDGPELGTAYRLGRELNIAPLVEMLGAQEDVIPLLSASDVFLLPSAQESFGLAALEAMACEVPVVASNVGGLPEVIEHGVTGFLHDHDRSRRHGRERDRAPHRRGPAPPRGECGPHEGPARSSASTASCRCTSATTSACSGRGPSAAWRR